MLHSAVHRREGLVGGGISTLPGFSSASTTFCKYTGEFYGALVSVSCCQPVDYVKVAGQCNPLSMRAHRSLYGGTHELLTCSFGCFERVSVDLV